jgi:hypothetical protein
MKICFFTILLIMSSLCLAEDLARWAGLMNMVQKEITILEQSTNKKPPLEYRLLELYTERIKLTHEKNNQTFLAASSNGQKPLPKIFYFKETKKEYDLIVSYGLSLLKNDPSHPFYTHITFNLGLNSRDYGKSELTEKMLLDSISSANSQKNTSRQLMAEAALAEYYYNEKKYSKAIKHYLVVVQDKKNEWLAKHTYNLSWCYLQERQLEKAIATMGEALSYNSNPSYVKISDQMLSTLSSFYTFAGKPLEAMELFKKTSADPIPLLLNLASKTSEKGHKKETELILQNIYDLVSKNTASEFYEELLHAYLDYYKQYGNLRGHWHTALKLKHYYSKQQAQDLKNEAIEKLTNTAGFLQLKLTKDIKEAELSYNKEDLKQVLDYYDCLIVLEPSKKANYLYFKGETTYSVQKLPEAAAFYQSAISEAINAKNLKLAEKAVISLLDLTSHEKLPKQQNDKYLTYAYTQHVRLWPRDEKSRIIFPKLFEIFHRAQNDKKASGVILAYNKAFPEDSLIQQKLMTGVLDQLILQKNSLKLNAWITKFRKGLLSFQSIDLDRMEAALASIYFNDYLELAKNGEKLKAASGFEKLFHTHLNSASIRARAAMYASMAYLETGDTGKAYEWQMASLKNSSHDNNLSQRADVLKVTERLYKLQDFENSLELSHYMLKTFCSQRDDIQSRFFEVSILTSLAEKKTEKAELIASELSGCLKNSDSRQIALHEIFREHDKSKDLEKLKKFVISSNSPSIKELYKETLNSWYWNTKDEKLRSQILKEYESINDPDTNLWLKELSLYADAEKRVREIDSVVIWTENHFDGDAFNASLEKHIQEHQHFKSQYQSLLQSSQTDLVLKSTVLFSRLYHNMGKKITALSPKGLEEKTLEEFKIAMTELSNQFVNASSQYNEELKKVMTSKEILSQAGRSIASMEEIEPSHAIKENVILIDRRGKQ